MNCKTNPFFIPFPCSSFGKFIDLILCFIYLSKLKQHQSYQHWRFLLAIKCDLNLSANLNTPQMKNRSLHTSQHLHKTMLPQSEQIKNIINGEASRRRQQQLFSVWSDLKQILVPSGPGD